MDAVEHTVAINGRVLGDFIVGDKLGEGGFGEVYRATQRTLQREAVVKILRAHHLTSDTAIKRFLREGQLACELDHPYAAHIYACGAEPDGLLWIAMELVRGTPLDALLKASGPIPLDRCIGLVEKLCEVVASAHDQGIVHRDIKPANVMVLSRSGRFLPKLLDLGIAARQDDPDLATAGRAQDRDAFADTAELGRRLTSDSVVVGSPLYMAPECWVGGGTADVRSDIYALGVLAYECLTGRVPFLAPDITALARAHAEQPVAPIGNHLPRALERVLQKALAKQPADRFANALEFAAALRASAFPEVAVALPVLATAIADRALAAMPRPLADAVALVQRARSTQQLRLAIARSVRASVRYLGVVALASRARLATTAAPLDDARPLLLALVRQRLDDREWLQLACMLCDGFAELRDAFPVPELVDFAIGAIPGRDALAVLAAQIAEPPGDDDEAERVLLARMLDDLGRVIAALDFLASYALVVGTHAGAERWMGIAAVRAADGARPPVIGAAMLVDSDRDAVLEFGPLVRVEAPVPGAADELFVLDGKAKRGAALISTTGFQVQATTVWDWLGKHLLAGEREGDIAVEQSPYRGLAAFTSDDAALFFGRERELGVFRNRLRLQPLLVVVGASGAGKSSFVHAGVVPDLASEWRTIDLRPGSAPLAALAAVLAPNDATALERQLTREPLVAGQQLRAMASAGKGIVLVVDQLEELFTLCKDAEARRGFAAALAGAARTAEEPVRVIVTLRDDFLVRTQDLPELRERIAHGLFLLATPAREDLLRILSEPCLRAGYDFDERELPARMVDEVAERSAALALLSFAAARLWELRDRHFKLLRASAYRSMDGVAGALAKHAESIVDGLPRDQQRFVRDAFRHLVTSENTRAVLDRRDLRQLLGADGDAVVEKLVGARLLVTSENERGHETVEIVHEALLSAWPRLLEWRREDVEGARFHEQLRAAARQWDERERSRGLLWRGDALADFERWRGRHAGRLTDLEQAFVDASSADSRRGRTIRRGLLATAFTVLAIGLVVMYTLRERAERERGRVEEASKIVEEQRESARSQAAEAYEESGRRALLGGDSGTALAFLVEARRSGGDSPALDFMIARSLDSVEAETATLRGHSGPVLSAAFSPDGHRILTVSKDTTARVWDAASGRQLLVLGDHARGWTAGAWSPDGSIATIDSNGRLRLWTAAGLVRAAVDVEKLSDASLRFSPDGKTLAITGEGENRIELIDAATGKPTKTIKTKRAVWRVDFAPGSDRLVAADETGASVWTRDGAALVDLEGHSVPVWYAQFSPDGTAIATCSLDGTARVWDAATGRVRFEVRHDERVTHLAYSPDGKLLATASGDRFVKLWNAHTGAFVHVLTGHTAQLNRIAFTRSGDALVSVAADGTVRVWDTRTGFALAVHAHGGFVFDVDTSADGRIVTSSWAGTARVFSLAAQRRVAHWIAPDPPGAWSSEAKKPVALAQSKILRATAKGAITLDTSTGSVFTYRSRDEVVATSIGEDARTIALVGKNGKDGKDGSVQVFVGGSFVHELDAQAVDAVIARHVIATVGRGTVTTWDFATGRELQRREVAIPENGRIQGSPDGRRLLVYGSIQSGHRPLLLATDTLETVAELGNDDVISAAFAPDGLVAIATAAGVGVWSSGGARLTQLVYSAAIPSRLDFSRDGATVAIGHDDGTVTVWSRATWSRVRTWRAHDNFVVSVAFSPDGALLATTGGDRGIRFWDASTGRELFHLSGPGKSRVRFATTDRLISSDETYVNVWRTDRGKRELRELANVVRCRLGLELRDGVVVPSERSGCD